MQLMSPDSWLLVVRQEREYQMRNMAQVNLNPAANRVVERIRQVWERVIRRQTAPGTVCCAVAPHAR